jgi:hypothetical protein
LAHARGAAHRLFQLPVEGQLPSFGGATGWLNSPPLNERDLRGKVVLVNSWTYTCINWLRQLPYVRAWAEKYSGRGLVVIDSDYAVWRAFDNHYWPALYVADAQGRIRHHYFGEGECQRSEMIIQQLLVEAGFEASHDMVSVDAHGVEAPADWPTLRSPENYTGYGRTEGLASPGGVLPDEPHPVGVEAQPLGSGR